MASVENKYKERDNPRNYSGIDYLKKKEEGKIKDYLKKKKFKLNNDQESMRTWCKTGNISDFQSEDLGSNPKVRIIFSLVDSQSKKFQFDQIVKNYHTYKPNVNLLGRQINWLVKIEGTNEVIGAIGLGSSVMAMKPRDDFIGWKKDQRLKNLVNTATNWRFCLMENGKGYGSQVLSRLCKEGKKEWKKKYGVNLVLLETLIEPPYTGSCYKGNGWVCVGKTKGHQFKWKSKWDVLETDQVVQKFMLINGKRDDSQWKVVTGKNVPKLIFVKPLHRYWKKILQREEKLENIPHNMKETNQNTLV